MAGQNNMSEAAPHQSLNVRIISTAIRTANGDLTAAAQLLGVTRTKLAAFIDRRNTLSELLDEIEESRLDAVEAKLLKAIEEGEFRALTYYLDLKGGKRGYGKGGPGRKGGVINVISAIPRPPEDEWEDKGEE